MRGWFRAGLSWRHYLRVRIGSVEVFVVRGRFLRAMGIVGRWAVRVDVGDLRRLG